MKMRKLVIWSQLYKSHLQSGMNSMCFQFYIAMSIRLLPDYSETSSFFIHL